MVFEVCVGAESLPDKVSPQALAQGEKEYDSSIEWAFSFYKSVATNAPTQFWADFKTNHQTNAMVIAKHYQFVINKTRESGARHPTDEVIQRAAKMGKELSEQMRNDLIKELKTKNYITDDDLDKVRSQMQGVQDETRPNNRPVIRPKTGEKPQP